MAKDMSNEREEGRPDPEELLRRYSLRDSDLGAALSTTPATGGQSSPQPAEYQHKRGRLRVYLASAAGTGKTYTINVEGINGAAPDVFVIAPQPVLDAKSRHRLTYIACKIIPDCQ